MKIIYVYERDICKSKERILDNALKMFAELNSILSVVYVMFSL
jgi:hypothetical protein